MKKICIKLLILFLSLSMLFVPGTVLADAGSTQGIKNPAVGSLGNNIPAAQSGATFLGYFVTLWQAVITIGGLIVLIYFVWGAIEWITAGGDSAKVQKARDKLTQSVIGLIVLVATFTLVGFISQLFFGDDFDLLNLPIPTPNEVNQ